MLNENCLSDKDATLKLFCELYQVRLPCVVLREIIHWHSLVKKLELESQSFHDKLAYVMPGYFYSSASPIPNFTEVKDTIKAANELQADLVLLPVIRNTEKSSNLDMFNSSIPYFLESIYKVNHSLHEDLRKQLGKKRYKEILRVSNKIDQEYTIEFIEGDNILKKPEMLVIFDKLHELNIRKYKHTRNHFNANIINNLLSSSMNGKVLFVFYRDIYTQEYVLGSLNLIDRKDRTIHLLVVGINRDKIPHSRNLYANFVYNIYKYGVGNNIDEFNLGRGLPANKLKLGANHFYILSNYLIFLKNDIGEELKFFTNSALQSIQKEVYMLEAYVKSKAELSKSIFLPNFAN